MTLSTPQVASVQAETSLLRLLRLAESALRSRLQHSMVETGLSPEHWRIMSFLLEHPGQRMTAIGEAAVLPSASLTRHVDRLVEMGVLLRRVDPSDRRSAVVALSPRGTELASRLRAEERTIEAELEETLGSGAFAMLRHALAGTADALR